MLRRPVASEPRLGTSPQLPPLGSSNRTAGPSDSNPAPSPASPSNPNPAAYRRATSTSKYIRPIRCSPILELARPRDSEHPPCTAQLPPLGSSDRTAGHSGPNPAPSTAGPSSPNPAPDRAAPLQHQSWCVQLNAHRFSIGRHASETRNIPNAPRDLLCRYPRAEPPTRPAKTALQALRRPLETSKVFACNVMPADSLEVARPQDSEHPS